MSREAKPYKYRGYFVTSACGEQHHKLCLIEHGIMEAKRLLRLYLTEQEHARSLAAVTFPPSVSGGADAHNLVISLHDLFLSEKKIEKAPKTYTSYRDSLRLFLQQFGQQLINSITEQDALAYKFFLLNPGSIKFKPSTINSYLRAAKVFLTWCVSHKHLVSSPFQRLTLLPDSGRKRLITEQEFSFLYHEENNKKRRLALLLFRQLPFRPFELTLLDWSWVLWDRHQIVVPSRHVKTHSTRYLTLIEPAESHLLAYWQTLGSPFSGYVFPSRYGKNRPQHDKTFSNHFRALLQRCIRKGQINELQHEEKLVLYSNRHTRITELVSQGLPLPVVQHEAGHVRLNTTQKYIHLANQDVANMIRQAADTKGSEDVMRRLTTPPDPASPAK